MKRINYIGDIEPTPGSRVSIGGRVSRIAEVKVGKFVWVRDATGIAQLTLIKGKAQDAAIKIGESLSINDFVVVNGSIPQDMKSKVGIEIIPESIDVVGKAMETSPIDIEGPIESSIDKRFDWRALDLRNPNRLSIFRIESRLLEGFRKYFYSEDFSEVFTPSLMGMPSEGGSEVFSLEHFGKTAYLRQDPQLHRQLLMIAGFERVYEIGPSWRAELSNTPRHMTEHRTCAAEISFINDEKDTMRLEEKAIISAMKNVSEKCEKELKQLNIEIEVPKAPFPELKFPEVYDILKELGIKLQRGEDLSRESEEALSKYVKEKYDSDFFFVNRFPFKVKPFYVMRVDEEPEWARSVDLMYKGLEMSSGGQREHRYERIIEQAKLKGMTMENIEWFTNFFKYGAPPHGGFSIGVERLTMKMLDLQSVRESTLFPRSPDRLLP